MCTITEQSEYLRDQRVALGMAPALSRLGTNHPSRCQEWHDLFIAQPVAHSVASRKLLCPASYLPHLQNKQW